MTTLSFKQPPSFNKPSPITDRTPTCHKRRPLPTTDQTPWFFFVFFLVFFWKPFRLVTIFLVYCLSLPWIHRDLREMAFPIIQFTSPLATLLLWAARYVYKEVASPLHYSFQVFHTMAVKCHFSSLTPPCLNFRVVGLHLPSKARLAATPTSRRAPQSGLHKNVA